MRNILSATGRRCSLGETLPIGKEVRTEMKKASVSEAYLNKQGA
jgi:hypothetical protein